MRVDQVEVASRLQHGQAIELFWSVPAGLEDVAASKLPPEILGVVTKIYYTLGSGYLTTVLGDADSTEKGETLAAAIWELVHRPPLCAFAAYISMGEIGVPRDIFEAPEALLYFVNNGFQRSPQTPGYNVDMGLRWQDALSILQHVSSTLAERLSTNNDNLDQCNTASAPILFRASFDRGDVQHKGVRSQDLAAGLGGVTGRLFPSWKVDLKKFDIEIMGRWIHEELRDVTTTGSSNRDVKQQDQGCSTVENQRTLQGGVIQVGVTLPLALSACPYRFRPMDGRTSLRIEIAFTLLALANPQSGDIVIDLCSGVGTIPIVGALHYPKSTFIGCEILPHNVNNAAKNMRGMIDKILQEEASTSKPSAIAASRAPMQPDLLVGDARAVCWRPGTVDMIVSGTSMRMIPCSDRGDSEVAIATP